MCRRLCVLHGYFDKSHFHSGSSLSFYCQRDDCFVGFASALPVCTPVRGNLMAFLVKCAGSRHI